MPKSKSLFFSKQGRGIPIGNLTSQLFGNIYLDELDHFMREKTGIKYYGRYVDDIVFVHKDKEFLKSIILKVRDYLKIELRLTLHSKKIYLQYYKKGVYFLGVFIKPYRIYAGRKTKNNFYESIRGWNNLILEKKDKIEKVNIERFIAGVNSHLGIMKHYNTYKLRRKMIVKNIIKEWWNYVFCGISFNFNKIELIKKYPHAGRVKKMRVDLVGVADQSA